MEALRKKLEDQKQKTRKLEDKNLEFQYEVNSFKKKEKKYLEQINSLKEIAKKYQTKLKSQTFPQSLKPATMNNLDYDTRDSTSTADSDFQRFSPPDHRKASPLKNTGSSLIFGTAEMKQERNSPKKDFKFARSEYIKSLQNLDIENNLLNEEKKKDKLIQLKHVRFEFKRGGTLDQEIDEVINEESESPNKQGKLCNMETLNSGTEKISANSLALKKRGSALHMEDSECKFNLIFLLNFLMF